MGRRGERNGYVQQNFAATPVARLVGGGQPLPGITGFDTLRLCRDP